MLHPSSVERVSALTDLFVALQCAIGALLIRPLPPFKTTVWKSAFLLLGMAAAVGVLVHGYDLSPTLYLNLWLPLNLFLGQSISMFLVGTILDLAGEPFAHKALPWAVGSGFAFLGMTILIPGSFRVFIPYEALAMMFALVSYAWLTIRGSLPGSSWMVAGIAVTMLAACVQATGTPGLPLFWQVDSNGLFHAIQALGIAFLMKGLRRSETPLPPCMIEPRNQSARRSDS